MDHHRPQSFRSRMPGLLALRAADQLFRGRIPVAMGQQLPAMAHGLVDHRIDLFVGIHRVTAILRICVKVRFAHPGRPPLRGTIQEYLDAADPQPVLISLGIIRMLADQRFILLKIHIAIACSIAQSGRFVIPSCTVVTPQDKYFFCA